MSTNNSKYYDIHDTKIQVDAFLSIPKILFQDKTFKKLTVIQKVIYSLYLNRYINTTYKDKEGPYIIYSDKDIIKKLQINQATCTRARKSLKEVGLINFVRGTGNNKIYLYSYNKEKSTSQFFCEKDLDGYKFYRFPNELFDTKYKNLPLNVKLIYAIYLDTMCISQMSYFVDKNQRIYFQEALEIQEKKIGLTQNTIKISKQLLIACELLYEYRPFSEVSHYYLLKLTNFKDNVKLYESLDKKEKTKFIKECKKRMSEELMATAPETLKNDYVYIKNLRTQLNLTQKDICEYINKTMNLQITTNTYGRWENGKRNFPDKILKVTKKYLEDTLKDKNANINEILQDATINEKMMYADINSNMQDENNDLTESAIKNEILQASVIKEKMQETINEKSNKHKKENARNITNTNLIDTNNNKTNLLNNLMNEINNKIYNSLLLEEKDKSFITASLNKLKLYKKFYLSNQEEMIEEDKMITYLKDLNTNQIHLETILLNILDRIKTSGYFFKTPDNQINCFLTFLFNDLKTSNSIQPEWYISPDDVVKAKTSQSTSNVDEEIKNYKWWE